MDTLQKYWTIVIDWIKANPMIVGTVLIILVFIAIVSLIAKSFKKKKKKGRR